jgi:hypothetical protein
MHKTDYFREIFKAKVNFYQIKMTNNYPKKNLIIAMRSNKRIKLK